MQKVYRGAKQCAFEAVRLAHSALRRPLPASLALNFHEIEPSRWPAFRAAVQQLKELGYGPVGIAGHLAPNIDRRTFWVSFDDNYLSWHTSLPLLAELGIQATFYVNTLPFRDRCSDAEREAYFDRLAQRTHRIALTRAELREIAAAGHEIGCHSHSHFALSSLEPDQWDGEIRRSRDILEDTLGREVVHFSYPYGMRRFFSEELRCYCRHVGFRTIAAGIPGLLHRFPPDPFNIPRTRWHLELPVRRNISDLRIDGRMFESLTGRSAAG